MQITKADARRVFDKLEVQRVPCSHHEAGFVVVDGVRVLKVHYSRGRGELSRTVAHLFRKSLKLTVGELRELVSCRLSQEEFVGMVRVRVGVGRGESSREKGR